ncbi:hypothetical protein V8C42DRAFT_255500 [Trichoderma barbatum]
MDCRLHPSIECRCEQLDNKQRHQLGDNCLGWTRPRSSRTGSIQRQTALGRSGEGSKVCLRFAPAEKFLGSMTNAMILAARESKGRDVVGSGGVAPHPGLGLICFVLFFCRRKMLLLEAFAAVGTDRRLTTNETMFKATVPLEDMAPPIQHTPGGLQKRQTVALADDEMAMFVQLQMATSLYLYMTVSMVFRGQGQYLIADI